MAATSLEVWGDPIAHSLSPALHTAAYRHLGWDWTYGRRRVDEERFTAELAGLDDRFRGLSLTMPLKSAAYRAAARRDARAELTCAVNTLRLTPDGPIGFNTDVGGVVAALREEGMDAVAEARIVGAGATATSALVALAELGAQRVEVAARRPLAVAGLEALGERIGIAVTPVSLAASTFADVPLTIATLPGDARVATHTADGLAGSGGRLLDVVYGHWPTSLSEAWEAAGNRAVSGATMLLHQAVLQIRVFATGDVTEPLPDEQSVVAVMRRALVGG
ncbi:shikimate dehydrogenase family protein [Microbacterium invictum]|uniref:Shikimate dehydrogenase n=1 Tax=Microbacterium invictum TaxID=515415 RepID=A0AA40VMC1_9MICO|nr:MULTISPECIES: shikimate dehydrogenase [Microbacterium]MBB4139173.1 shikimate dehydrogenase [Microbacterium invictum]